MLQVWFMQGLGNFGFGQVLEFGQSKVNGWSWLVCYVMLLCHCLLDRPKQMPNSKVS